MDNSVNNTSPPEAETISRFEERRRQRSERRMARGSSGSWVVGAVLIALGVLFLLQNQGLVNTENWWALFILIPAFGALSASWRIYQTSENRITAAVAGSLIVGLILLAVSAIFFFGLNWTLLGPALLILAGIALVVTVILPR
jgi:hypothetical protein